MSTGRAFFLLRPYLENLHNELGDQCSERGNKQYQDYGHGDGRYRYQLFFVAGYIQSATGLTLLHYLILITSDGCEIDMAE